VEKKDLFLVKSRLIFIPKITNRNRLFMLPHEQDIAEADRQTDKTLTKVKGHNIFARVPSES
jgi:hypothetical protein